MSTGVFPSGMVEAKSDQWAKTIEIGGFTGLLILIADVWAIINVLQSPASMGKKVLWIVLIILLPVLGLIIWFFLGPRAARGD